MGIGFAFPYLILILYPRAINYLPRSGHWMVKFRNILALFVLVTAVWLCYVLAQNSSLEVGLSVLAMSILLVLSFRIGFTLFRSLIAISLVIAIFAIPHSGKLTIGKDSYNEIKKNGVWQYFEKHEIDKLVSQGKTVVVDVTADWCLTCKFNQYRVLEDDDVVKILKSENVVAMRADITKTNKEVMEFMNSYSRFAIPFDIVFGPNAKGGVLLSELLNKEDFITTIKKVSE